MISELVVFWEFWIEVRKYRDGFGLCIICVVVFLGPVLEVGKGYQQIQGVFVHCNPTRWVPISY